MGGAKYNQKEFIKQLLRESIELSITDETLDSNTFDIYYKSRKAGHIICGPASAKNLGEDTIEIYELQLDKDYTSLNIATQAVKALFNAFKDMNTMVIAVPPESTNFWEKIGFTRLNDNYHMLSRGH